MAFQHVSIFDVGDYDRQICRAADILSGGEIVVLPTETVYGAAAILGPALDKLKTIRGSSAAAPRPFTIHLSRRRDALPFLGDVSEFARRAMLKLWPGPIALMFDVPADRRDEVARKFNISVSDLYAGESIVLRYPDHVVTTDVLATVGKPVALTVVPGVNPGEVPSDADVSGYAQLLLDAGPGRFSKPSTMLRIKSDGYEILRAGIYDQRIIDRLLRTTVLFVCSGNTCRSPMAEALARHSIAQKLNVPELGLEEKGISVLSAGSFAMPGARATPQAVDAVRPLGADLSRHRSRPLSVELIHQADVIFTMGASHAMAVSALVPSASEKVTMLDPDGDVDDPIGSDLGVYESLAKKLQGLIEQRLEEKHLP